MKAPKVSVVMPVYNAEKYIEESVKSILTQTLADFELIILDDHSTDGTINYLQTLTDPRIRLITKPAKKGLSDRLNEGFTMAQGEYIARMDSDDISDKERLAKQVTFMDQHPEYICCGCNYIEMPSGKKSQLPETDEEIRIGLFSNSQFAHPTVMLRRHLLKENNLFYDPSCEPAEDYKLWLDLSRYGKLVNLPAYLLNYRIHESQISHPGNINQKEKAHQIAINYVQELSKGHPHSGLFAKGIVADSKELEKYTEIETIIQRQLEEKGFKKSREILVERKKNALRQGLLSGERAPTNAIKILISSGLFLGLKFYFSLLLNRQKKTKNNS